MKCIVRVIEARGIRAADINGKSDPYVKLSIKGSAQMVQRTRTLFKTLSPIWNEEFTFQNVRPNDVLEIRLWDHDTVGSDDYLGQLDIPLQAYVNNARDEWKPILERKRGLKSHFTSALTGMNNLHTGAGEIHLGIFVGNGNPLQQQPNMMNQQSMQYTNQQQSYGTNPLGSAPQYGATNQNYPSNANYQQQPQQTGQYPQNTYGQNVPGIINYPNSNQSRPQQQPGSSYPQQGPIPNQNYGQAPTQGAGQYPHNTYGQNVPGIINYPTPSVNNSTPPPYAATPSTNYPVPQQQGNYPVPSSNYPVPQQSYNQQQPGGYPPNIYGAPKETSTQFPNAWGPKPVLPENYSAQPSPYGVM